MENNFVDGLFIKRNEKAPEFVITNLSFNEKFIEWLKNNLNAKGWANVDILRSKEGKLYAKKNEYKPELRNDPKKEVVEVPEDWGDRDDIQPSQIPF